MPFETTVRAFAAALGEPSAPPPAMTHGRMGAPDARRFAVYRNNVAVGLIGALEARYPVSRRIAGEDLFCAMARAFVRAHRPRSPVMIAYGGEFPEFVAEWNRHREERSDAAIQSRRFALHPWIASLTLAMTMTVRLSFTTLQPPSPTLRGSRTLGWRLIMLKTEAWRLWATLPRSAQIRCPTPALPFTRRRGSCASRHRPRPSGP